MNSQDNPYAPPASNLGIVPSHSPRQLNYPALFAVGLMVGAVSFLLSMALIPSSIQSISLHDLRLANHLGFIYPVMVGLWASWVRRSLPWAVVGVVSGLLIGSIYYLLCGFNFLAVMVGFPCLLGGCTSVLLGTRHDRWTRGILERFFRGLIAGFALGFVYAVLLNVGAFLLLSPWRLGVEEYSWMMWRWGTVSMAIGSGLYFVLFHWSAGLHPIRENGEQGIAAKASNGSSGPEST